MRSRAPWPEWYGRTAAERAVGIRGSSGFAPGRRSAGHTGSLSSPRMTAEARRAAAGNVCAYCGEKSLDGHQRPEHPIPAAIGSVVTVFTVCDACNERVGREVDQPWLDHDFVRHERRSFNLGDPRHAGKPPASIFDGMHTDEEGHRVAVTDGIPRYVGSITDEGDRMSIRAADPARAEELLARVRRRLAADGKEVSSYVMTHHSATRPMLSKTISVFTSIGVRMGAKLGLAFGSLAYPEEWRTSPEAAQLRGWLWIDEPVLAAAEPVGWMPSLAHDREHPFSDPPNHNVSFWNLDDTCIAVVVLVFGTLGFTVPVAPMAAGMPHWAWQSGPSHGGSVLTTRDALMLAARDRFIRNAGG